MTSTTRRLARVFGTTIFALSAIPDLLTVPDGEHLIEIKTYLRGDLPLPVDSHADSRGRRPLGTSTGASTITSSTTVTRKVDDAGDSANPPPPPTSILL
jgi:hypothetical protein